jgi:hypothetical protein
LAGDEDFEDSVRFGSLLSAKEANKLYIAVCIRYLWQHTLQTEQVMNKKYLLTALAVGVAVSASSSLAATKLLSSADNAIAVGGKVRITVTTGQ